VHAPAIGVGAGGWSVWWLRDRPYADGATDAHSLELQTLAELGLVGIALLAVFLGGVGVAAATARRAAPTLAVGPIAGAVVWIAHSPLDWDWQMPALTLVAVVLVGGLLALAECAAQDADGSFGRAPEVPDATAPRRSAVPRG
jgi:O-antigen ligase